MNENIITANDSLEALRTEIVESQKARMDFLKYKLIAIASLGAIGLGFSDQKGTGIIEPDYLLCIIPFVCAYVDMLCYHNNMRILVIANFLNYSGDLYENYIGMLGEHNNRQNKAGYYFELEDFSLHLSSIFSSIFLAFYGLFNKPFLFIFGIISVAAVFFYKKNYEKHVDNLFATAKKLKNK